VTERIASIEEIRNLPTEMMGSSQSFCSELSGRPDRPTEKEKVGNDNILPLDTSP
jgi:hypothetical protein